MGRKPKPPDLFLVLDFGGSLTKVIYMGKNGEPTVLCMEPEVIGVPAASVDAYERLSLDMGEALPQDRAWVKVDESYYAVGYLAAKRFHGNAGLSQLKYERAYPKTLAAVWVAATSLGLGNRFKVALAALLPPGEYENASRLEAMIASGLERFETPDGTLRVKLTHFDCKPEGAGIYLMRTQSEGMALKRKTCAVVMLGYRNASVLVSERGQVGKRVTSSFGFVRLVEMVDSRTSGLDTGRLARAIALGGEQPSPKLLQPLLQSVTREGRKEEMAALTNAIVECRPEYALALRSWLREVLPRDLDEVILSGGTADYLKRDLEEHFAGVDVIWHGVELPPNLRDAELGNRISDAYGMYLYFQSIVGQSLVESLRESTEVATSA
ncbi:hypothetical protein MC7420_4069 [Coleofasciculus chthonoplastes PCC 7420]|uniref:Actin-like protein N-terminal domain-containing protein n=1 Tax=Coleofasciculus chthonoplastes PCC 7420 TaxID=118168 RepID=B4VUZ6_9CYAN|nr:ParM/StbA family protein [Coleofasciculus chthonoplastes]EDX74084.1 hypothetical protein MC7420_4069 [Coleofasciculus chthonoplastes PCC 7420]